MQEKNYSVCGETVVPTHSPITTQSTPTPVSYVGEMYELHEEMPPSGVIYHMDTRTLHNTPAVNWHENVEILFVRAGEGRVLCNSESMEAVAGDIFVFSCHHMHSIASTTHIVYDVLIVDKNLCRRAGFDTNTLVFTSRIREDRELVRLYRAAVAREAASPSAFHPTSLCPEPPPYGTVAVQGATLSLMAYLCTRYARPAKGDASRLEHGVRRAIHYMQEHLAENMSVDGLAAVAGFSKYHFLREFKRYTSFTVVAYLNIIRIERAKQMLSHDALVSETALACGFGNFSYFSKVFRNYTGVSPMQYVKKEAGKKK